MDSIRLISDRKLGWRVALCFESGVLTGRGVSANRKKTIASVSVETLGRSWKVDF